MKGKYDDIINLPHHVSPTRPHMPMSDRAAQFSPFRALSGYDAAVKETARLTAGQVELAEDTRAALEKKLGLLANKISESPIVTITYFQSDKKKEGGEYIATTGIVKQINDYECAIIMKDGRHIAIADIIDINWNQRRM